MHPTKTRLIEFGRYAAEKREKRGEGKPETFNFLGFAHVCGVNRDGRFTVQRKTIKKKLHAKVKEVQTELKRRMHATIKETGQWLKSVVAGHYRYYAVPGNYEALDDFRYLVYWNWRHTLRRRSQKGHVTWERMNEIANRWLRRPKIYHENPLERIGVIARRRSLVR